MEIDIDSSDFGPESIEAPDSVRGARKLIVVGGGRGGVGKSLVAGSLAVYFAQLGKNVLLVDADETGTNLHTQFGLEAAKKSIDLDSRDDPNFQSMLVETNVPGLRLLPYAHDAIIGPGPLRAARKARWLARLRSSGAEYIVVDVGPGTSSLQLDLMLSADVPICVTVPEPPAIETTYRFLRAAFVRRLKRALKGDKYRTSLVERALLDLAKLPSPLDLVRALGRIDKGLSDFAWSEANRLRMNLVVNQTRVRSDLELGNWMSALAMRHYGVHLDELGHIEHDDTVWLMVRRRKPLLVDSPTAKAARNVERIARRVFALMAAKSEGSMAPPPMPEATPTLYYVLGTSRSSSDEEIRRAYKRQREVYASDGLAACSLLGENDLKAEQARLDDAYDTLLDPIRRKAYDLSTFPEEPEAARISEAPPERRALAAEQLMLQNELASEIGPDTEFTGSMLKKVRESQGIELTEISARTKIARAHLEAIEEEAFQSLPAAVYVRGFVSELAKYLRLDPLQVQRSYMRRVRETKAP